MQYISLSTLAAVSVNEPLRRRRRPDCSLLKRQLAVRVDDPSGKERNVIDEVIDVEDEGSVDDELHFVRGELVPGKFHCE